MNVDEPGDLARRVIVVAPTTKDGEITRILLAEARLSTVVCHTLASACDELRIGAGALLLTEEALLSSEIDQLLSFLNDQPSWSDLPIVLLLHEGRQSSHVAELVPSLGNVTLLERPAPSRSVVSAVQTAVGGRERQYQIRQLLEAERLGRAEAERVSRMKDEFLATLSHELRTPLNAIFGWSQILKIDSENSEAVKEGIEVIDRNVRLQTQLIEDLLDMSRIISGKIRLAVQRVDLPELIDNAIESVRPAAEAKALRLERIVDPFAGPVSGDPGRLQQVLWNLLTNAIKFTPKGGTVQVLLKRVNSDVELSVVDTGEGIDPEFLPYLFERFSQADASTTRNHGGLGIGLSIVKTVVELHGGSVHAQSGGVGQGSAFVVTLPIHVTNSADGEVPPLRDCRSSPAFISSDKLSGLRVLVVDDEPDARTLVERFLVKCGATAAMAASTQEAHAILHDFAADVIVSDIGMPGEDGYTFIRTRRSQGDKTPAVALTAFARSEDRIHSIQAGFQAHLPKPVEPAELIAVIATLAGRF